MFALGLSIPVFGYQHDYMIYAATLRHTVPRPEQRPICVRIDTNAGHSLGSNQTKYFEETGYIYSFLLNQCHDE